MAGKKQLIYKEDIMDKLIAYAEKKHEAGHNEIANGILKAVNYISNNAVSVDAVKVEHGRWRWCGQDRFNDAYSCSECGKMALDDSNYCPNCGAKMDGDGNG